MGPAGTTALMGLVAVLVPMPPTEEIVCTDEDCFLDLFENHYTYDVPDDLDVTALSCPVCGGTECLDPVEL